MERHNPTPFQDESEVLMNKYEVEYKFYKIILKIIGKLSLQEISNLLDDEEAAKTISDWYYKKRMEI